MIFPVSSTTMAPMGTSLFLSAFFACSIAFDMYFSCFFSFSILAHLFLEFNMLHESERKWNNFFDLIDKIVSVSAAILIIEGDFGIIMSG